ncbi:MAG TPA: 2,3-bisphosphoglycerate-independent phosphoglycerate mutase [Gemmatimonadales bacterium]|nr:2,3-bisphosphoglycerate-independent phosphoglycerate mutase [Gemmatimonadales bacterium]
MSNGATARRGAVVLVVLDGWGFRRGTDGNAIELARSPTWHKLWETLPRTLLDASGRAVGLPEGQMGNSEVGHLNLGAGRVVHQDIVRISDAIESGAFFEIPALTRLVADVRARNGTLHLFGLVGPGGVHALDKHLLACVELATRAKLPRIAIQALLDGRDTLPASAEGFMRELVDALRGRAVVATATGRYYGMDRDKRWDRTKLAYDAMVHGVGTPVTDPVAGIAAAYARGETDEFVKPLVVVDGAGKPVAPIRAGDGILCFNFRADRMRQMVRAWTLPDFADFDRGGAPTFEVATMTSYDARFTVPVAFGPEILNEIMADVVSGHGMGMLRTAETEKYAHVTYFFNGGVEQPYRGEERLLVPSQKVATYDLKPEMSAAGITDILCGAIERRSHDFILANYANGDMVGHTGKLPAVVRAVETVDSCLARVIASADKARAALIVTADHGNCELMIDPATGGPHTAHTTNPVPLLLMDGQFRGTLRSGGALRDVGPTVLALLGLEQPAAMTGRDLRAA